MEIFFERKNKKTMKKHLKKQILIFISSFFVKKK